ncbi:MAG: hypothetical protein ACHQVS_04815 [Candidatus Babeliales bacterium]
MKKQILIILGMMALGGLLWLKINQPTSSPAPASLSRTEKDTIIEQALTIELPETTTAISEEANKIDDKAIEKVHESQYEQAIAILLSGLKKFPHDFTLQSDLAALLGDCSEITSSPLKERMVQKAKELFDRLLQEAEKQPKDVFYPFKNEYCYRLGMYREQYELGLERVNHYWGTPTWNSIGYKGYYSQGVGAANYARKLIEQGNKPLALDYAQKAIVAWAQYFSYDNTYYNAYVHYAYALGILGYKEDMMRALERSASIIKKDLSYFEFKEVIDFVEKCNT